MYFSISNKNFPFKAIRAFSKTAARVAIFMLVLNAVYTTAAAQQVKYKDPKWWFGLGGGANFNFYRGYLQRANEVTNFPAPFRKGDGRGVYGVALLEYRVPKSIVGFMLAQGVDDRRGTFEMKDQSLSAHLNYISIEPSLRLSFLKSKPGFYVYGGPRFGFLMTSDFVYRMKGVADFPDDISNPDAKQYLSSVRKNPISMQVGAGYDIRISKAGRDQFVVSPFVAYFPTMWRKNIRTIDRTYLMTARAGIAIKFGRGRLPNPLVLPPNPPVVISDRDGDKIFDLDDKCPDVPGLPKYEGCPIPDTDGDGINDEEDKCPTVKGFARYQGCPIPDTDGDGVNDEIDKCPTRPGPASNQGCPVIAKEVIDKINFAAKNVFFATGSYKLLPKSFSSLNAVVALMKDDLSLMIDIDGHTDSQGSDESNRVLSDNRAAAVKNYLVGNGVSASRLKSMGYGESRPVADNATAAGRALNRRTEMTVRNF